MTADSVEIRIAQPGSPEHIGELALRLRILRIPLGMPPGSEVYEHERDCLHVVAVAGTDVVGCVMFHRQSESGGRLLQMAVDPAFEGLGIGRRLVARLEREVGRSGTREIVLHARDTAIGFYEKLGYVAQGAPYVEVGIPHQNMVKRVEAS